MPSVPVPYLPEEKAGPKFAPSYKRGVFIGWATCPGGKWNGRYYCTDLESLVGMDLRVGREIKVQEVSQVHFDPENIFFPLKKLYDHAVGTIEGLSQPYETSIADVAPQGIDDFKIEALLLTGSQ